MNNHKYLSPIVFCIVCWYVLLCTVHYFNQRSLWNDEQCVFNSIKAFSPQEIFSKQLLHIQVFPRVYLFFIQRVSEPFNFHLLSLRLLPFISMLCAFGVWLKIASYQMKNSWEYLTFVLSWAASSLLIYYAAELKQYSMDVLAGAVFLLFLYKQEGMERASGSSRYVLWLVLLPILGLFSYTAFLFMIFPLFNLMLSSRRKKMYLVYGFVYVLSCAAILILSYFFDMRWRPVDAITKGFGDYFISFESVGEFFKTLNEGTMNLFSRWFAEKPRIIKKIAIFFVPFGFIYLFYSFFKNIKKEGFYLRSLNTIALVLFLELFLIGALKKYPFTVPRTSLFYCPIVLALTTQGITHLKHINKYICFLVHGLYIIFLCVISLGIARLIFAGDLGGMPQLW